MTTQLLPQRRADDVRVAGPVTDDGPWARQLRAVTPWRLLALVAGLAVLFLQGVKPFVDIDVYWHVLLGQEILATGDVRGTGRHWAFTLPDSDWVTTQWLSEVVLALVHDTGGWRGVALLRLVCAAAVVVWLGAVLLRGHRTVWAPVVFSLAIVIVSAFFQERPLLASVLLSVWLAALCGRVLSGGPLPRAVPLFLVTCLWANLHGQWVVVPGCLGLLALGRTLEWWQGQTEGTAPFRLWGLVGLSASAGAFTPYGPELLLTPFTFRSATTQISEWMPTSLDGSNSAAFLVLVTLVVAAWAMSTSPPPLAEITFVLGMCVFALLASRNVPPTAVLLAPVVLHRLEAAFPREDRCDSAVERRRLSLAALVLLLLGAVALPARFAVTPDVPATVPVRLAEHLASLPGEHVVVNDYNTSGALLFWGGDRTRVAIDGRADRYGGSYIARHQAMLAMHGDWQRTFNSLKPNYVVPETSSPLVGELVRQGWSKEVRDGKYVLLRSPDGTRATVPLMTGGARTG